MNEERSKGLSFKKIFAWIGIVGTMVILGVCLVRFTYHYPSDSLSNYPNTQWKCEQLGLELFVDASGNITGIYIKYRGRFCVLSKTQGTVLCIVARFPFLIYQLNSQGRSPPRGEAYAYDAWDKLLSCTGTIASVLGQYNPLRYRGCVYNTETGFYYL